MKFHDEGFDQWRDVAPVAPAQPGGAMRRGAKISN